MHRKVLIAFSVNEKNIEDALLALARERLTKKQKLILAYIQKSWVKTNVSQLAPLLAKELNCSESAVWNNLTSLKRALLISYGSLQNKGAMVNLTAAGILIIDNVRGKNDK